MYLYPYLLNIELDVCICNLGVMHMLLLGNFLFLAIVTLYCLLHVWLLLALLAISYAW